MPVGLLLHQFPISCQVVRCIVSQCLIRGANLSFQYNTICPLERLIPKVALILDTFFFFFFFLKCLPFSPELSQSGWWVVQGVTPGAKHRSIMPCQTGTHPQHDSRVLSPLGPRIQEENMLTYTQFSSDSIATMISHVTNLAFFGLLR
jgi:hypothetical protein